jgi:hypothetical protein
VTAHWFSRDFDFDLPKVAKPSAATAAPAERAMGAGLVIRRSERGSWLGFNSEFSVGDKRNTLAKVLEKLFAMSLNRQQSDKVTLDARVAATMRLTVSVRFAVVSN